MRISYTAMLDRVIRRSLTDEGLISDARDRLRLKDSHGHGSVVIDTIDQGNFTIVMLNDADGHCVGVGASKRNTDDAHDPSVGYNIAVTRAIENGLRPFVEAERRVKRSKHPLKTISSGKYVGR